MSPARTKFSNKSFSSFSTSRIENPQKLNLKSLPKSLSIQNLSEISLFLHIQTTTNGPRISPCIYRLLTPTKSLPVYPPAPLTIDIQKSYQLRESKARGATNGSCSESDQGYLSGIATASGMWTVHVLAGPCSSVACPCDRTSRVGVDRHMLLSGSLEPINDLLYGRQPCFEGRLLVSDVAGTSRSRRVSHSRRV
jgi:hypothetical protein